MLPIDIDRVCGRVKQGGHLKRNRKAAEAQESRESNGGKQGKATGTVPFAFLNRHLKAFQRVISFEGLFAVLPVVQLVFVGFYN